MATHEAFGEPWRRHSDAVTAAIRSFTGFDPEDVMQESFIRILQQIQKGQGPQTAFRAYAIMTARNVAINISRHRSSGEETGADDDVFEETSPARPDIADRVLSDSFALTVFTSLPTRWQQVLWYREVEDLPVHESSKYLGISDNATSVLLKRAREGFKQAWIAHNPESARNRPPDCKWLLEKLPKYARGKSITAVRKNSPHTSTHVFIAQSSRKSPRDSKAG